jgi:signal transduction histidine kinase/Tfp pilus assembly protein PilF
LLKLLAVYRYLISLFAFAVLTFLSNGASATPPTDPRIKWYDDFFTKKKLPVEERVKQTQEKLMSAVDRGDKKSEAAALQELGLMHLAQQHLYDTAMGYFIKALAIQDSLNMVEDQIFTYLGIARVFEDIHDYDKSATSLMEALALNETLDNVEILVYVSHKLGQINAARGHFEEAFQNFETMLDHQGEVEEPGVEAEALFQQGHLYTRLGDFGEALEIHKKALRLRRRDQNKLLEAQSLNDIGELYRLMKRDDRVLANHKAALEIREAIKDEAGIAQSHNNLGVLYYEQEKYDSAILHLQAALTVASEAHEEEQVKKAYESLSLSYKAAGDFEQALKYHQLYVAISEFNDGEKSDRQIVEAQNRYLLGKKQTEIERLQAIRRDRDRQLAAQLRTRNFLFLIIALTVIVIGMTVYLYLVKRRSNRTLEAANARVNLQNQQLQELNATKDKFFSIISHDLKGPLNSLTSFSNLLINYYDSLSRDEVQMLAKDFDKSVKNLFTLLENLLEWSRSQTGNIEFTPETFNLSAVLRENKSLLEGQAQNKKITLGEDIPDRILVSAHKQSINTVIRNLISNAIKFTPEGGMVLSRVYREDNTVVVSVSDTGVGMTQAIVDKLFRIDTKHSTKGTADEKGTGLGLILCKDFVEKNGGKIWVQSEPGKGSMFSFSIPFDVQLNTATEPKAIPAVS